MKNESTYGDLSIGGYTHDPEHYHLFNDLPSHESSVNN